MKKIKILILLAFILSTGILLAVNLPNKPTETSVLTAKNTLEKLYIYKDDFEDVYKILVMRTAPLYFGEIWVVEYGVGCPSMWTFEGKYILSSYSLFLDGVGGKLYLPGRYQSCRIWDATKFEDTIDDLRDEDLEWLSDKW